MGELTKLFISFLVPGVVGFGGGIASIAIISNMVVDTFNLLTPKEMSVLISFSNALPGPIATLLAFGTGFMVKGIIGGIVALIALILPSCVIIVVLYNLLIKHKNDYRVKRISKYIIPLIIALFLQITFQFISQSFSGLNNNLATISIILITVVLVFKFKVHPAFIIVGSMAFGYFML